MPLSEGTKNAFTESLSLTYSTCKPLNILAVDDEAGARAALDIVLRLAGHRTVATACPEEALKLLDRNAPDLIITNHNMPDMNGLAFVRRLKQLNFCGKIIVVSAYVSSREEREYRKLGVVGLMEKPFNVAELRDWIDCMQQCGQQSVPAAQRHSCPAHADEYCWLMPE